MNDSDRSNETPQRVLIVEDEPRMRQMLERALPDMGFDALSASSGEEALRAMQATQAAVLIIDLNLPGMGGLDFLEAVRAKWPCTQAVILTGFGDLDAAKRAIRLDIADFLTKPCTLGELETALGRAWKRHLAAAEPRKLPSVSSELAESKAEADQSTTQARQLRDYEREHVEAALARHNGNRAAAAEELGISVRTLYYRLAEYENLDRLHGETSD